MEDCKCGRIPPCYGGKKFRIHEELENIKAGDETHDMFYELNRRMCDFLDTQERIIDKLAKDVVEDVRTPDWAKNMLAGIPEQLSRAEYEILDEILKEKNRFMEEKKTTRMTKAEAFEYLKGKKVLCKDYGKMEAVQGFVKSLGFHWADYSEDPMLASILFLGEDERLTFSVSLKRFEEHKYEEISADDILSIEIVEENKVLSVDCALEHAKWIMKYLREECSPHTKMIIEGDHAELVEGVKSVVWKEDME